MQFYDSSERQTILSGATLNEKCRDLLMYRIAKLECKESQLRYPAYTQPPGLVSEQQWKPIKKQELESAISKYSAVAVCICKKQAS